MVWIETPTNPTMKLVDIMIVAQLVHEKDKNVLVVVDNTYLSSYFQVIFAVIFVNQLRECIYIISYTETSGIGS